MVAEILFRAVVRRGLGGDRVNGGRKWGDPDFEAVPITRKKNIYLPSRLSLAIKFIYWTQKIMAFELNRILQALLFSSSDALSIKDIQGVITRFHQQEVEREGEEADETGHDVSLGSIPSLVTATQIREAMEAIRGRLDETDQVFQLIEGHSGYRLVVRADFVGWVRCLRGDPKPTRLSQAALETLAIIAYRQPTTRAEIESIRGVSADGALNRLLERELVEVQGRAELPGRPIQYGVTEKFLEFVGVKSLDELPASDVLSPRQIDEWIQQAANPAVVADEEVGLSAE